MNDIPTASHGRHVVFAIKLAAAMIGAALLLTLARLQGLIGRESVERAINVVTALACAAYCNVIPKALGPPSSTIQAAKVAQTLGRVSGWTLTLAFLISAAGWAFAPTGVAQIGSIVSIGVSGATIVGYSLWKRLPMRNRRTNA
ncbi:MAG: hypothetical protein KF774_15345 [Planctomyces sp.]|nr:hypothetical protein [Planctomyces sp.]